MESKLTSLGALRVTTCAVGQRHGETRLGVNLVKLMEVKDPGEEHYVIFGANGGVNSVREVVS